MKLVISPISKVPFVVVGPFVPAFTVSHAIFKCSLVRISIVVNDFCKLTDAFPIFPFTVVFAPIWPSVFALAVLFVIFPHAFIRCNFVSVFFVMVKHYTFTGALIISPTAFVHGVIIFADERAYAMSLAIIPLAFVS